MIAFAFLVSGVSWAAAYLLIIRRNFIDRTCGMPFLALGANVAWEVLYVTVFAFEGTMFWVTLAWALLDAVICAQYVWYGPAQERLRRGAMLAAWAAAAALVIAFAQTHQILVIAYAFGQNLLMSVLFVWMLLQKKSSAGQSLYIAFAKALGTNVLVVFTWDQYTLHGTSIPMLIAFVGIPIFDLLYIALLWRQLRAEGKNPFARL